MFLVAVLLASAYWGLRYAVVMAIGATAAFNFFFLPPVGTFTIADPQNWVALFAFLVTALVASDLAERARRQAEGAKQRRREVERLFALSQRLLASENVLELLNALPKYVQETFSVRQRGRHGSGPSDGLSFVARRAIRRKRAALHALARRAHHAGRRLVCASAPGNADGWSLRRHGRRAVARNSRCAGKPGGPGNRARSRP